MLVAGFFSIYGFFILAAKLENNLPFIPYP
jgi:hypothetical protein